jgi:NADH-quinone oxidoreductase subunit A
LFLLLNFIISIFLLLISVIFVYQEPDKNKTSPYECGFQPFEYFMQEFDIKYYVIALLFLISDLEIVFLLPLIISLQSINIIGFSAVIFFFMLLILGFFYE